MPVEAERGASAQRAQGETYTSLEGARGFAAVLVALFHYPFTDSLHSIGLIRNGWTAVDLFFVMSGFIMAAVYGGRLTGASALRQFALKRIGRLYPLHLATLALAIAAPLGIDALRELLRSSSLVDGNFVRAEPVFAWPTFVSNLLLVQALGLHDDLTYNTPAWSISTEFWTYAVFAATCAITSLRLRLASWGALVVLGMWVLLFASGHPNLNITYDFAIFRCLAGFFLGALAANWRFAHDMPSRATIIAVQLLFVGTYVVIASAATALPAATFLLPLVFAPVVVSLSYDVGPVARLLSTAPMRWLGAVSYSIYMIHEVLLLNVVYPLRDRLPLFFGSDLPSAATYLALVLAGAMLSYRWIELPARNWFRRVATTRAPAARGAEQGA